MCDGPIVRGARHDVRVVLPRLQAHARPSTNTTARPDAISVHEMQRTPRDARRLPRSWRHGISCKHHLLERARVEQTGDPARHPSGGRLPRAS